MINKTIIFVVCFLLVLVMGLIYMWTPTYSIADFVNIEYKMRPEEVIGLIGRPAKNHKNYNTSNMTYKLNDGSEMNILFLAKSLLSLSITDSCNRHFVSNEKVNNVFEDVEIQRQNSKYAVADFVNVEHGMSYVEVMALLRVPLEEENVPGSGAIIVIFDLGEGSEMRLSFNDSNILISMLIIDPIGRVFITSEEYRSSEYYSEQTPEPTP